MKKFLRFLTGRLFTFIVLISLQAAVLGWLIYSFMHGIAYYIPVVYTLGFIMVFFVISRDDHPAYKIPWIIVILTAPVFGVPFYLIFGNKRGGKRFFLQMAKYQEHYVAETQFKLPLPKESVQMTLAAISPQLARQTAYIYRLTGASLWQGTETTYFGIGEEAFACMLKEIEHAKRYVLLEFFIIDEGEVWTTLLSLLRKKVAQGVKIRFMYDDLGSIQRLPPNTERTLREAGIMVGVFNRMHAHLNPRLNYRDHRKILVVDGDVGFTGGINLADEYVNRRILYGHWKDATVMLKGDAVWNLTLMFFQQWMFTTGEQVDLSEFTPRRSFAHDGFVQPFGDSPLDGENIAENAYIQIINQAKQYVWITTPYLIIDTQMTTALCIAAQSGIDVRIITPHFPDKWYVHPVTRSNYLPLLRAGVRIFEYTPGFIHAKMFVSDDEVSIVGTTNMDYRSFYLHFECGVIFFHSSVIHQVRNDISRTLDVCREITVIQEESVSFIKRFGRDLLKVFSPLM